jgi:hypothetical protein
MELSCLVSGYVHNYGQQMPQRANNLYGEFGKMKCENCKVEDIFDDLDYGEYFWGNHYCKKCHDDYLDKNYGDKSNRRLFAEWRQRKIDSGTWRGNPDHKVDMW